MTEQEIKESFERVYKDLLAGFEETHGCKPNEEERKLCRQVAITTVAFVKAMRKKGNA